MTKLHDLHELGQSVWLDFIRRQFTEDGSLQKLIDQGVRGITSNPSIFEKAIGHSDDYDTQMSELIKAGKGVDEIYEALVVKDIQDAADLMRPVYDDSKGEDGYVSLEVSPTLARDTQGTIEEARRLFAEVDRPNVMIKVPATPEGIPAIQTLIGEGININVTLMFSLDHYDAVAEAYISGLEQLVEKDGDVSKVASVASFFVSRVETNVDNALQAAGNTDLLGTIAVANTRVTYERFLQTFSGDRWQVLVDKGARVQRPLWASTGTKNKDYSDVKYVDELIGANTVNTLPPATLDAFLDHGTAEETIGNDLETAHANLKQLAETGVDLDQITEDLQNEGVEKFAQAFEALMQSVTDKREKLLAAVE